MAMPTLHLLQRTLTLLTPTVFSQSARPAIENRFVLFAPRFRLCWTLSPKAVAEEEEAFGASSTTTAQQDSEQFEWRLYTVNECQPPSFLSRLSLRKIFLIGNAVRLLRYMLQEDYHAKSATELFTH